jgi:hypothetical protein
MAKYQDPEDASYHWTEFDDIDEPFEFEISRDSLGRYSVSVLHAGKLLRQGSVNLKKGESMKVFAGFH